MDVVEPERSRSSYSKKLLAEETNRCVSCGLCLPHCPTYHVLQSEADSPRGRIAMMNGVVHNRIPLNEKFIQHMDRCLACRACESACPNHVAYGQLIDEARKMIQAEGKQLQQTAMYKQKPTTLLKGLKAFAEQPIRFESLRLLLYLFQKSGGLGLLRWLSKFDCWGLRRLDKMLWQIPSVVFPVAGSKKKSSFIHRSWQAVYPAVGNERGKVGLFLGCVARLTDAETLNASIFVLNRLGFSVYIPQTQTCCGAMHQHAGDAEIAAQLIARNQQAFSELGLCAIVSTASGCCVQLAESQVNDVVKVIDISKFLMTVAGWDEVAISPLAKKIVVQDPCSLRHVLGDHHYPYQLMHYIPDAQVTLLADNDRCCGAAGTYFIEQPELADRLLDDKINAVIQSGAHYLVTSNVGCSMHIAGRLREIGTEVVVMHPVTLLARQMGMR